MADGTAPQCGRVGSRHIYSTPSDCNYSSAVFFALNNPLNNSERTCECNRLDRDEFLTYLSFMGIIIRKALLTDAAVINELSKQLGYENTITDTSSYLSSLIYLPNEEIIVAEHNALPIAWMQLSLMFRIESGYFVEITGLVVDENYRSLGIGNMLIDYARNRTQAKGIKKLRVRTNIVRQRTHAFYERNGFTLRKEQRVYEMNL